MDAWAEYLFQPRVAYGFADETLGKIRKEFIRTAPFAVTAMVVRNSCNFGVGDVNGST
jgi:hypothetical protein